MAEKRPHTVTFIQVTSSEVEDDLSAQRKGNNENAVKPNLALLNDRPKFFPVKPLIYNAHAAEIENSFREVEITISNHRQDMFLAKSVTVDSANEKSCEVKKVEEESAEVKPEKRKKKKNKRKNNSVMPLDVSKVNDAVKTVENPVNGKKKGKETKAKKKKKGSENKAKVKEDTVMGEISATGEKEEGGATGNTKSQRKLPCLFGFVSTWLAKRKERRREKKRKAIASRTPPQRLVEYDRRTAQGGEAFTIEVDNRPVILNKPLLPPIKQAPGPICRGTDNKHWDVVCRRADKMAQRQDAAREYEKKKTKCKERRAENDYQFRHKADLSIRQKQINAERNRNIRSRCKSRLRAPFAESSVGPFNEPSAKSSLVSIRGPSCYSEEENDRDVWDVDGDVDIPFF